MSDFMNTVFGPLSGEYCLYFFYLSIFSFFLFTITIVAGLVTGLQKGKSFGFYLYVAWTSLMHLVTYFVTRLMFSICSKSL
jgi:hypothetical protein